MDFIGTNLSEYEHQIHIEIINQQKNETGHKPLSQNTAVRLLCLLATTECIWVFTIDLTNKIIKDL